MRVEIRIANGKVHEKLELANLIRKQIDILKLDCKIEIGPMDTTMHSMAIVQEFDCELLTDRFE